MADTPQKHSFLFGARDMYAEFGLIIESIGERTTASPRIEKITVPGRNGVYIPKKRKFNERPLVLRCATARELTEAEAFELAYILSYRNRITLYTRPNKYYIGRVEQPDEVERILGLWRRFTLRFVCDPFIYGATRTIEFSNIIKPDYAGTAQAPTRIEIRNTGDTPITGIHIQLRERST